MNGPAAPAAIGSVKSLIGHTKADADMAGLIKATMALSRQILPPSSGFDTPHPLLTGRQPALQLLAELMLLGARDSSCTTAGGVAAVHIICVPGVQTMCE